MASVQDGVIEVVCRIAEIPGLEPDQDYYAAGLESVRALEVLIELETAFGVTIPDDAFIQCRTAADLTRMIADLRASQGVG